MCFHRGPRAQAIAACPASGAWCSERRGVCARRGRQSRGAASGPLDKIALHSLRHSFADTAESLGATIPTIAALLDHRLGGVTGGYILKRVDVLLIDVANRVADHIGTLMTGEVPPSHLEQFRPRGRQRADAPTTRAA